MIKWGCECNQKPAWHKEDEIPSNRMFLFCGGVWGNLQALEYFALGPTISGPVTQLLQTQDPSYMFPLRLA
jgi:hypothetical protein